MRDLRMNDIDVNLVSTTQRKNLLENYFRQNVISGQDFFCPNYDECRNSHQGIFYEGQLHHVGDHYDISFFDKPLRVMVVGQEYGHGPACVSMEDRSKMVLEQTGLHKSFSSRNPHMRGTTSVLRLLFGIPLGSDQKGEFLKVTNDDQFHLFDAFSLVNFLVCSAVSENEGRRGKSTPMMRRNCLVHFKKTLEILEPTVIIVQGKSFWASVQNAFGNLIKINDSLFSAEIIQKKVMVAVFSHPSTPDNAHNWGRDAKTRYLLSTVVPTIELIRQKVMGNYKLEGEHIMSQVSDSSAKPLRLQKEYPPYDTIFEQIKLGLLDRFPREAIYTKAEFEHSTPNRMRIYFNRARIKGSHYEICFRGNYYEFALHFESSPAKSLERRQAFDSHLGDLTSQIGRNIKSGKLENRGWMRVWYEESPEQIDQVKIEIYIDSYSRFIAATYPLLAKLYD